MEIEWKDCVVDCQINLGDFVVQGGLFLVFGVLVKGVFNLQLYLVGEGDFQYEVLDIILIYLKNIIFGFLWNIRIEVDKDICSCKFIIVLMVKFDSKFEEEDVSVKIVNVKE